ncbi:MAG: ankyrin repeat domain-containing protein [Chitinispirillaceae bacterium]|nr:ankyrin repeat domain-containing protein [Chitinispirillaceae bacterium]
MIITNTSNEVLWSIDDYIEFLNAVENGDIAMVRRMIENGMDPDIIGPLGWTAMRKAAAANRGEVALELLNRGAAVDAADYMGQTALMLACAYGHHDMVLLLLFYGADPNLKNHSGRTPLMIAAGNGNRQIVGALLDTFPQCNMTLSDHNGKTALDMAIINGHHQVAKMLEAANALRAVHVNAYTPDESLFLRN